MPVKHLSPYLIPGLIVPVMLIIILGHEALWDDAWWRWHGLCLIAFVLALVLVVRRHRRMVVRLRHALAEREQAEAQLLESKEDAESINRELETVNRQLERAIEEVKQMAIASQAANNTKSAFLANMSHEIRTPLTAILGFAENLLDPTLSQTERLSAVDTIRRSGKHLLQIINDILDLSKIEAGRIEVERVDCSPCHIVSRVASVMRVRADAKGMQLHTEYLGPIPERIQTDPTRLRQILLNLVGNAVKFTTEGSVRVLIQMATKADDDSPKLQFEVIDTGAGMTREQTARLFQPFVQADMSTTRRFGGTGLGLAISKRFTEMLDGDITVESQPSVGSTFRVRIATGPLHGVAMLEHPFEAALPPATPRPDEGEEPTELNCRILLAEDGPDNRRLISFVLEKAGARVTVVDNGRKAFEQAMAADFARRKTDPQYPFDVILMDMQMPVMDGYNATRMLRSEGYTGSIIALTAHAMESDRKKCLEAGCDDYATKPIDRAALLQIIREHIRTPAPTAGRS